MSYLIRSICLKYRAAAIFLLFFQSVSGQYNFQDLDQEFTASQKLIGKDAVLMVWNKDSMLYKKEAGEFNSKTTVPIASCSKWLTAALVLQFVDEGKLSLDDKIGRWLPEFDRYGKSYITIRHCLSHRTGISDDASFLKKISQRKKYASLEDEVNSFAARDIRTNAGEDFWYGNIGLNIAGRILEVISKKKFDVLIKQKLLNPIGMRRTSFATLDASAINPSAGASSTADDYMKFLVMLLNNGKVNGKQILSEESVELLKEIQTSSIKMSYAPKAVQGSAYALGSWVAGQKDGKATCLVCPGWFGSWSLVDFCRGYACLVLVKSPVSEDRADAYTGLKKAIDAQLTADCP